MQDQKKKKRFFRKQSKLNCVHKVEGYFIKGSRVSESDHFAASVAVAYGNLEELEDLYNKDVNMDGGGHFDSFSSFSVDEEDDGEGYWSPVETGDGKTDRSKSLEFHENMMAVEFQEGLLGLHLRQREMKKVDKTKKKKKSKKKKQETKSIIVVDHCQPNSQADLANIERDWILVSINRNVVLSGTINGVSEDRKYTFDEIFDLLQNLARPLRVIFWRGSLGSLEYYLVHRQRDSSDSIPISSLGNAFLHSSRDIDHHINNQYEEFDTTPCKFRQKLLQIDPPLANLYSSKITIMDLFENQVKRSPNKIAVQFENKSMTYHQLNVAANKVAHGLIAQLNKKRTNNVCIGICISRNCELLISLLGIWKSGCAYVPLDPAFPNDRLLYMMSDSSCPIILTEKNLMPYIDNLIKEKIDVNVIDVGIFLKKTKDRKIAFEPEGDAPTVDDTINVSRCHDVVESMSYVIYTSGSTGKPKGVCNKHAGVANFACAMIQKPGIGPEDVIVAVSTISFDVHVLELFVPLIVGARVVVASRNVATDGYKLGPFLDEHKATVFQATPSTYRLLIESQWMSVQADARAIKFLCGGEAMTPELAQILLKKGKEVWNMYGPTETTVWSTVFQVTESFLSTNPKVIPIGEPIANMSCHVLDPDTMARVPTGQKGLLYISGPVGMALKYQNLPELTAKSFVPDPFTLFTNDYPHPLMYNSGDLARYSSEGHLECLGRADQQVKISGYRIELGEIEARISEYPDIKACVVLAKLDQNETTRLVVFYELYQSVTSVDSSKLRAFIASHLPSYMIPNIWMHLKDGLPTLPNHKINRNALPEPNWHNQNNSSPSLTSLNKQVSTSTESLLIDMVKELLGLSELSIADNFFTIGGNSLFAMRLQALITTKFDCSQAALQVTTIFEKPTIKQLAAFIDNDQECLGNTNQEDRKSDVIIPLQIQGDLPPLFLIHPAGGLIFPYFLLAQKFAPHQPVYGIQDPSLNNNNNGSSFNSIEEMASYYLHEVQAKFPEGPYYFSGWSVGGNIAFEMACQLSKKNTNKTTQVPCVILIDSMFKEVYNKAEFMRTNFVGSLKGGLIRDALEHYYLSYKQLVEEKQAMGKNAKRARVAMMSVGFLRYLMKDSKAIKLGENTASNEKDSTSDGPVSRELLSEFNSTPQVRSIIGMLDSHMKLAEKYNPGHFDGNLALIKCQKQPRIDRTEGWMNSCTVGQTTVVLGNHYNLVADPQCNLLVDVMKIILKDARQAYFQTKRQTSQNS